MNQLWAPARLAPPSTYREQFTNGPDEGYEQLYPDQAPDNNTNTNTNPHPNLHPYPYPYPSYGFPLQYPLAANYGAGPILFDPATYSEAGGLPNGNSVDFVSSEAPIIMNKHALATVMGLQSQLQHQHQHQHQSQQEEPQTQLSRSVPASHIQELERQRVEIEKLRNELERQRFNVENLKTKRENQKQVIDEQHHEMEAMRNGIEQQRREIDNMRNGIEQQRLALEQQRHQLEQGMYEREHLKMEADSHRHELEQTREHSRAQIEAYKAELERKGKQLQLLDGECARLESELTQSREKTKDLKESTGKLIDVQTSTQDQFLVMKETNLKLKSFIQDLTLKIHANERELVSKDREIAALSAKKQSTEEASSVIKGEFKDTKKVLKRTAEVVENQQQLVDDLQKKLERSAKREKETEREREILTSMYEEKLQKMDIAMRRDLHIKMSQSESVVSRLKERINVAQAQLKDAQEKNDALQARVAVYEQDLIASKRKAASLKEQLAFESRLKEMNNAQLDLLKTEHLRAERAERAEKAERVEKADRGIEQMDVLNALNETNAFNLDVVRKDVLAMVQKLAARPPPGSPGGHPSHNSPTKKSGRQLSFRQPETD